MSAGTAEPNAAPASREARPSRTEVAVFVAAVAYFAARALYYAFSIEAGVPADELSHLDRILAFSESFWPPADSEATYASGLITRVPTLYYIVMGRLLWLNAGTIPDLVLLRVVSVLLSVATVFYAYRLVALLASNGIVRGLFLVMLTNTAMFTFLAGSVSYDSATNLLATMATYYLFSFFRSRSTDALLAAALCTLMGSLTKTSILPLAALLGAVLLVRESRPLASLPVRVGNGLRPLGAGRGALLALVVLAGALNLQLYGVNLVRYHALVPDADQVIGLENALKHSIFRRNHTIESFRAGEITFKEAMQATPEDDLGTQEILFRNANPKKMQSLLAGPARYTLFWVAQTIRTSQGILGQRWMLKSDPIHLGIYCGIGFAALVGLSMGGLGRAGLEKWAAFITLGYALILLVGVHHPSYAATGNPYLALQGRYFFPVIAPFYALVARSLVLPLPERMQPWVALGVGAFFVYGDFPYFLLHVTPEWLAG
jgi:hypothetical protein